MFSAVSGQKWTTFERQLTRMAAVIQKRHPEAKEFWVMPIDKRRLAMLPHQDSIGKAETVRAVYSIHGYYGKPQAAEFTRAYADAMLYAEIGPRRDSAAALAVLKKIFDGSRAQASLSEPITWAPRKKTRLEALLSKKVANELHLSARVQDILDDDDITTLAELVSKSRAELVEILHFKGVSGSGEVRLNEIIGELKRFGELNRVELSLGMDINPALPQFQWTPISPKKFSAVKRKLLASRIDEKMELSTRPAKYLTWAKFITLARLASETRAAILRRWPRHILEIEGQLKSLGLALGMDIDPAEFEWTLSPAQVNLLSRKIMEAIPTFSTRIENVLHNANLTTIAQLAMKIEDEMARYRGLNQKSAGLLEIKDQLRSLGISLGSLRDARVGNVMELTKPEAEFLSAAKITTMSGLVVQTEESLSRNAHSEAVLPGIKTKLEQLGLSLGMQLN